MSVRVKRDYENEIAKEKATAFQSLAAPVPVYEGLGERVKLDVPSVCLPQIFLSCDSHKVVLTGQRSKTSRKRCGQISV